MTQFPKSIESYGGIELYLNATKDEHNGLGFSNWLSMRKQGVDTANLARAFGVGRDTMYRWIKRYEWERK
jgi:hypothetical protein